MNTLYKANCDLLGTLKVSAFLLITQSTLQAQVDLRDAGPQYHSLGATVVEPTATFSFVHNIENLGPSTLSLAEMTYYLSTNNTLDASDVIVGGVKTGPFPVSGAAGTRVNASLKVPANFPDGSYRLIGRMTATGVTEPEVRNNVFVHPNSIQVVDPPLFDLRSSQTPTISRTSLLPNDTFEVTGRLVNNGPEPSPGFTVTWRLSKNAIIGDDDDIVLRTLSFDSLNGPPGPGQFQATRNLATQLIISSTTAPSAGSYRIGFLIEAPQDTVQTNNAVLIPSTITLLDAHPGDVDLHFTGGFGVSTTTPPFDGNFQLRGTIRNRGNTASSSYNVAYYASTDRTLGNSDDVFLAINTYDGLSPLNPATGGGASEFIDQKLNASGLTKDVPYYLVMIIVGGNDDNTANNTWISGTTVTPGDAPDYRMGDWHITNAGGFNGFSSSINFAVSRGVRFRGRVHNDTPRAGNVDLEVTWTQTSNGNNPNVYRGMMGVENSA